MSVLEFFKFSALLLILGLGACKNVPDFQLQELDPKIVLHVRLMNDGRSVDMDEEFTDNHGYHLRLDDLAFYLSNIYLKKTDGKVIDLDDVLLFDFTEYDNEGNRKKFTRSYPFIVPQGDYESIGFDLGLPADLNASDPTTFSNDDPLRGNEMYWSWATKYRFIRFGARLINDDTTQYDFDMMIHTGLDTVFVPGLNYPISFTLESFQKDTLFIDLDWNKVFHTGNADSIDISQKISSHGTDTQWDREISYRFSHNFANAINGDHP